MIQDKKTIESNQLLKEQVKKLQEQNKILATRLEQVEGLLHLTWDDVTKGYLETNANFNERTKYLDGFTAAAMRDAVNNGNLKKSTTVSTKALQYQGNGRVALRGNKAVIANTFMEELDSKGGH